ncbi:hypothetical protein [Stenotrophomonas sp.]|uniref:hypothetical protein n=1 Tax=Stenotrophomonas sp. TaxID=69392 RepID=UPI002D2F105E|nr:hypothetical protein [Stenotrophomonas sp.]HYQ21983.1 hypothetical protein [Stenotrophomonas sp.]
MKVLWALTFVIAVACAGWVAWQVHWGGAWIFQAFGLGAVASLVCVITAVAVGGRRRRLMAGILLAGYLLAFISSIMAIGNVR